ncbi:hypothetical protein ACYX6U_01165 [Bacillus cereus]|uniref:Right handed beta helix domain-containing protein n=1 Tax=Bacillus cereus VD196 TaxID=1053243 RepID=A0A9W5Q1H9_BACCE|nr:hypothetical protein [Bacillus cereus]EOO64766.1 hypothetical protein IKE_04307 [Bacillus cereus VD196]
MAKTYEMIKTIKTAIYGQDVGSSLADGLEAINKETEKATLLSSEIEEKQSTLEKKYDNQISNMTNGNPSISEMVDFRTSGNTGQSYVTAGKRADALEAQLFEGKKRMQVISHSTGINIEEFPMLEGEQDDSPRFKRAIEYCIQNELTEIRLPNRTYYVLQSINTKGIKLVGVGKPFIPLLDWEYTRPWSNEDKYMEYRNRCKGSIITTDANISIFSSGLTAKNIGIFGNLRSSVGSGIESTSANKAEQEIDLYNCIIVGFKDCGIKCPHGVISASIQKTIIAQNGKNGIFIGRNPINYTGETNLLNIQDSFIIRNESHGIYGDIAGRGIIIQRTSFEYNGEPSDPKRQSPSNINEVVFGCVLNLYNAGGFTNGALDFSNNYSEETYGLLKINAFEPVYGIKIVSNMWKPYDNLHYSCGISLDGWISGVTIDNNNFHTMFDYVLFEKLNNIKNVKIDIPYNGLLLNDVRPTIESRNIGDKTFLSFNSDAIEEVASLRAGTVIEVDYDANVNVTWIKLNTSREPSFNFGVDGTVNENVGYLLMIDETFYGFIQLYSAGNQLWQLRGDRTYLGIGDGSVKLYKVGGVQTVDGSGKLRKIVIDWDGQVLGNGR